MAFFDRLIRPHFDRQFFEQAAEAVDGAFASAFRRAASGEHSLPSQMAHARGMDRYFAVQSAVMKAAVGCGAEEIRSQAGSFPMPLAKHRRFLVATSITDSLEHLRRSKARRLLAGLNGFLEPFQPDLWDEAVEPKGEMLFGMLLIAKGGGESQQLPSGIFFGVPSASLQSWHFYKPLSAVISLYSEEGVEVPATKAPQLRKVPRSLSARSENKK